MMLSDKPTAGFFFVTLAWILLDVHGGGHDELPRDAHRAHPALIAPTSTTISYQADYDSLGIPSGTEAGTLIATLGGDNVPTYFSISGTNAASFRMRGTGGLTGYNQLELTSTATGAVSE